MTFTHSPKEDWVESPRELHFFQAIVYWREDAMRAVGQAYQKEIKHNDL